MLKIRLIVVDRTRAPFLKEGEDFYLQRLKHYTKVEWVEVRPVKMVKGKSDGEILAAEAEAICKKMTTRDHVIALDRTGETYDSERLAAWIQRLSMTHDSMTFVIGGPLGLSEEILQKAHSTLSLSPLTFTHEMTRLILLEQLYRAFTILNHEPYHK